MVAVLVLAAGASTRMGGGKLLLDLGGESLLRRTARRALEAGTGPVVVVLGECSDRAREALDGLPCAVVADAALPTRGMNASLAAGIAAVPDVARAVTVVLADMPLVAPAALRALADRHRATGAALVVSRYGDVLAPPVLYDRALLSELAGGPEGDGRGREVVRRHLALAELVDAPQEALADVDLPADLDRVRALLGAGEAR